MATVKKCDRCGKMYEGKLDRVFKTPDGFLVNSVRLGNWNQKGKKWVSLASAYDLCSECASKLYDILVGAPESNVQMRNVERDKANTKLVPKTEEAPEQTEAPDAEKSDADE